MRSGNSMGKLFKRMRSDGEVKVDLCALLWLEKQYFVR